MCSIIGFAGKYESKTLHKVFNNSRIRGLHAFGYSYFNNNKIVTNKFLVYDEFVKALDSIKPDKFIAHFRYSTSGDYKELSNNQPLEKNNTAFVFNGVVSQKNKKEMEEEYGCEIDSENDGWILLSNFNHLDDVKNNKLTYASMLLQNNQIVAIRNKKRPMWQGSLNGNVYIASTKDILKRSGVRELNMLEYNQYHRW